MTDDNAVEPVNEADNRRKLALLRAVGLDKVPVEQRELALAIAKRYDLDLMLKHLVLIEGRPYISRDGLLWSLIGRAHFDGIDVSTPVIVDEHWTCTASVYRNDMTRPFVYSGRYPVNGNNKRYGPEMAIKTAESMALRRAFNVSAPSEVERWDADLPSGEPTAPKSLAEHVAAKVADVQHADGLTVTQSESDANAEQLNPESAPDLVAAAEQIFDGEIVDEIVPMPETQTVVEPKAEPKPKRGKSEPVAADEQCASMSPYTEGVRCTMSAGHSLGIHRAANESWT